MARKDSEHQKKSMSLMFRGKEIFKPLNTGRIDDRVACVREWIANIFFYTKNGTTVMIDAGYNYERLGEIKIITGHTGWTDDLEFAFRHRTELCAPFKKRMHDPVAPYDGYDESGDTEERARSMRLAKQIDYIH